MRKIKITFFLFIIYISTAISQQWYHGYAPHFRHINDFHLSSQDVVVAVGGNQSNDAIESIFKTIDYCNSWELIMDLPNLSWLKGCYFITDSIGFAVGFEGKVMKTTDMGATWTTITSGTTRNLNSVFFTNSQTGYCAGGDRLTPYQTILKTTNGGQNWTTIYDEADFWLKKIWFIDNNIGVATGDSGVVILTENAGNSWDFITVPLVRNYNSIFFIDESTGYIAGGNYENTTILKTEDGGYSWNIALDQTGGELNDIYFIDANIGYAVGKKGVFLKTTDGGANWIQQTIPYLNANVNLNTVVFKNENFGIAMGQFGEYFLLKAFPTSEVQTLSALSYQSGEGVFNCNINTNGVLSTFSVVYGTDPELNNFSLTSSQFINTYSLTPASANATGLISDNVYYYSCQVNNISGSYHGDTLGFQYTLISPDIEHFAATAVTSTGAILNGGVRRIQTPSSVFFEYSLINGTVSTVPATPSAINDTLYHSVSATVSGLIPDSVYIYRVKVVNSITQETIYSDYRYVHTGQNTIPNWNFEDWTTVNGIRVSNWINIFGAIERISPGYTGNYAAKIEHTAQSKGIIMLGMVGDGLNETQGIPYNARPDSFQVMLNYNIIPEDTALIVIQFKNQGQYISQNTYLITGNSSGNFELFKRKIEYNSSEIPDEVFIGIISTNMLSGFDHPFGNWLIIDDFNFTPNAPTVPNQGFENWDSFSYLELDQWTYLNMKNFGAYNTPEEQTVVQTIDAQLGNYAAEMKNSTLGENPAIVLESTLNTHRNPDASGVGFDHENPAFKLTHKPRVLNGFYKFSPLGGDSLVISCVVYNNGSTIASGQIIFTQTMDTYFPFELKLIYADETLMPDSATIGIKMRNRPVHLGSVAYIDNLRFDGFANDFPVSYTTRDNKPEILIYPNPGSGLLIIQAENIDETAINIQIIDLAGRIIYIKEQLATSNGTLSEKIDASRFNSSLYFVTISGKNTQQTIKWIKQ